MMNVTKSMNKCRISFDNINEFMNHLYLSVGPAGIGYPAAATQDLTVYFVLRCNEAAGFLDHGTISLLLKSEEIKEPELYRRALENTRADVSVTPLSEIIGFPNPDGMPPIDVVSNKEKMLGAGVILFPEVFSDLCKKHGVDQCVVLPSSIHEVLVHYTGEISDTDIAAFTYTVKAINSTELAPDAVLSNHCYIFDATTNTFRY